jgi:hypothetical protein
VLEVQAQLTCSPYDKEPFHKKQPLAIASGEDIKRTEDSPGLPHETVDKLPYFYFESPVHWATTSPTPGLRPKTDLETHPVAVIKSTILWTPSSHTISAYDLSFRSIKPVLDVWQTDAASSRGLGRRRWRWRWLSRRSWRRDV